MADNFMRPNEHPCQLAQFLFAVELGSSVSTDFRAVEALEDAVV